MKLHQIQGYIQNIFLAEYDDKLLLLDGCARADVDLVCEYVIKKIGKPLDAIKLIVVTHMHPDHAGGAHKLREKTGALIVCHPNAPQWYRGFMGRMSHLIDIILLQYVAHKLKKKKRWSWYPARLIPDLFVRDKQKLPGFQNWEVMYTPGHTNHDLSLRHVPSNQIYVADLIVKVKGQLRSPYPVCHPNQYRQSLCKLKSLDTPTLMFAHLPSQTLTHQAIDELIAIAPEKPKNHWYTMRNRISRVFANS